MITLTNQIHEFVKRQSSDAMKRQQVITYLIATCLLFVGMPMHLLNVLGSSRPTLRYLSIAALAICLVVFVLWLFRKVSLKKAFGSTSLVILAIQSAKIVYIALTMDGSYNHLIVMNGIISMMLMALLAISYMRLSAIITGIVNGAALVFASIVVESKVMWQYTILIIMFTVFFMIMADMMYRNVKHISDENKQFHSDEQRLLQTLRLNRKEIRSYIEMCRTENPADGDTDRLFSMLSETSQRNVINAVERKKAIDASRAKDIKEVLPSLTPMELEVARLVLRDMKLSQIIDYTGKSESNISVVRSRIRKKLGLKPGEDLRQALMQRLGIEEGVAS